MSEGMKKTKLEDAGNWPIIWKHPSDYVNNK